MVTEGEMVELVVAKVVEWAVELVVVNVVEWAVKAVQQNAGFK